jgi:soluble lytic murein transglycosylase-like protein
MSTGSRAALAQPTGHDLSFDPRRVRSIVLAAATTLALAVLSAAAARFDGWGGREPAAAPAAPAAVAEAPAQAVVVARPGHASGTRDQIDALTGLVARKYRVSPKVARDLIGTAYREGLRIGVDPLLLVAVIAVESRFNPIAQSDAGAVGLMQVIPGFHEDKFDAAAADPVLDPHANIRLGARVLREYIARAGGETAGLQMYNGSGDDPTNAYANKVLAERARLQQAVSRPKERTRA